MPIATTTLLCLVLAVSDGDTLKARCQDPRNGPDTTRVVRLASIDAPERDQPYGWRARKALADLTLRQPARLVCRKKNDRYGRLLCNAWVTPANCARSACEYTLDAGQAMLSVGLAWWEPRFAREQTAQQRGQYEFAQSEARARRAGLWRDGDEAVPPWKWRRDHPGWPHPSGAAAAGTRNQ